MDAEVKPVGNVGAETAASGTAGEAAASGGAAPDSAVSDSAVSGSASAQASAFPAAAGQPTQQGPQGIRFDFNLGARVVLPPRATGSWRVRLRDLDTGNILFQSDVKGAFVSSAKRFYVRFGLEVWEIPETPDAKGADLKLAFSHELDLRDQDVMVQFPVGTLGDILAWFPYAARFAEVRGCRVICAMSGLIIPLLQAAYPHIRFVTHEQVVSEHLAEKVYATYSLGLFFDDVDCIWQPTDFRHVGLHRTAGYILGVDPHEEPPKLHLPDDTRPIAEPYVCIAVQSSTQCKYWNNPYGWRELVTFLKARGYRVICIDQKPVHGTGLSWNYMPHGVEDETGDRPLTERARWLKHCEFFVGLSSGLAWLAWAVGAKVVMISGFTHPTNEFETPYRVINWHACNSCWNDPKHRFDHKDFMWCPRHVGTPRQFECTRLITSEQVISIMKKIPDLRVEGGESVLK